MTAFNSKNFEFHGGYLHYVVEGQKHFIARFKYKGGPVTVAKFKSALRKLYTVEEYLERVANEAPLKILMNDGHLEFDSVSKKFILNW